MGKKTTRSKTVKKPVKAPKKKAVASPPKRTIRKTAKALPKSVPKKTVKKAAPKPKKIAKAAKPLKPRAAKKPKAAPAGPKGYTASEYATFKEWVRKFSMKTNQELKDLLRKNLQSMSGNKDDLIYKCADGATLGRIPRCPNCFGGRYIF